MTTAIKRRRGTTAQHATFTGLDGEITVDTDKKTVVVHDGATPGGSPLLVAKNPSFTGNLTASSSGARITGDFSNATIANRVMFQTSTVNGGTLVRAIPNGTSQLAGFQASNSSDPTNSSGISVQVDSAGVTSVQSIANGSGAWLPLTFNTGNSERMRIDASGNVGIGVTNPLALLDLGLSQVTRGDAAGYALFVPKSGTHPFGTNYDRFEIRVDPGSQLTTIGNTHGGTGQARALGFLAGAAERLRIEAAGNVLVISPVGLGYGTGAGGTVTQATSKSTNVTLNRPTGKVTMNNAALGAGAAALFNVNNSLCQINDTVVITPDVSSAANLGNYRIECIWAGVGVFGMRVTNISAGSLSEAVAFNFAIIKGAKS